MHTFVLDKRQILMNPYCVLIYLMNIECFLHLERKSYFDYDMLDIVNIIFLLNKPNTFMANLNVYSDKYK